MQSARALAHSLREGIRGAVLTAPDAIAPYTGNFSRLARGSARAVVVPACEEDVAHALRVARALRVAVTVRGAGHSGHRHNLPAGGILIANVAEDDDYDVRLLDEGRVDVAARTTWWTLQRVLVRHGRAFPVLTDYLGLTVGGTLSVGGYGVHSLTHGCQAEWVERLRLVTPDGAVRWCSPTENADLFRHSLAGLGRLGVIERVVLRTTPYRELTDLYTCAHPHVEALVNALAAVLNEQDPRFDAFDAVCLPGQIASYYARSVSVARRALLERAAPALGRTPATYLRTIAHAWSRPYEQVRDWAGGVLPLGPDHHIWALYAVDLARLPPLLRWCDQERRHGRSAPYLPVMHLLAMRPPRDARALPFAPSSLPGAERVVGVGLYYRVSLGDEHGVRIVRATLRQALDRCLALGGRPYRFGCDEMAIGEEAAIYGEAASAAERLRDVLDPDHLFNRTAS